MGDNWCYFDHPGTGQTFGQYQCGWWQGYTNAWDAALYNAWDDIGVDAQGANTVKALQWRGSGTAIIALKGTGPCTHTATQMLSPGLLECCFHGFAAGLMETRAPSPGLGSRGRSAIATMSLGEGGTVGATFPTTTCSSSTARSLTARQGFIAT